MSLLQSVPVSLVSDLLPRRGKPLLTKSTIMRLYSKVSVEVIFKRAFGFEPTGTLRAGIRSLCRMRGEMSGEEIMFVAGILALITTEHHIISATAPLVNLRNKC